MQESIAFLVRVQCRRKESSRSLSHLLMSFLYGLALPQNEDDRGSGGSVSVFDVGIGIRYFAIIYNFSWSNTATAMRVGSFHMHV